MTIRRALLSVSDKTGLAEFAQFLSKRGVTLLSTGGTAAHLRDAGLAVTDVGEVTGFPEIMDGRIKTLHPRVHGGILARRDDEAHLAAMREHGIEGIDLVVLNLYPFEATVSKGGSYEDCVENIDIGGPAMLRAAAKNHAHVGIVTDPADYSQVCEAIQANDGALPEELRRRLAAKAFARTAAYDAAIGRWFAGQLGEPFPARHALAGKRSAVLRYGENPHQQAALYAVDPQPGTLVASRQHQGKELSYNNIQDADAAWALVCEFSQPAVAIIKHANPCGVAVADALTEAYGRALACDPQSAFGGILAVNRPLDGDLVEAIGKLFLEVIIAPEVTGEAERLLAKKPNLRLLTTQGELLPKSRGQMLRTVSGGYLLQDEDTRPVPAASELKIVTRAKPSQQQMDDLRFAFAVCKHLKSNAIVLARGGATIGLGAGQMSRVDSVRLAGWKASEAGLTTQGCVMASDAFFPFDDNIHRAAELGVSAIIQPGGSVRDAEIIATADEKGIAMAFTGQRHFRH